MKSLLLKVKNQQADLLRARCRNIGTAGYGGHILTGTSVFKKGKCGCGYWLLSGSDAQH